MQDKPEEVNLDRVLRTLRRRAPWVVLCVLLGAGAAYGVSKQQTKEYTATASVVFNENLLSQQIAGLQPAVSNNAIGQQATNVQLLRLGDTAAKTANALGNGLTTSEVEANVSVEPVGTTNVVAVAATSTSPELAAEIANFYGKYFVKSELRQTHRYVASALDLVEKQLGALSPEEAAGAPGQSLENRAQSLRILDELRAGNVRVAETAKIPTAPSSPKVTRNTLIGAVLGLLIGIGLAILLERLDRRIKDPRDLEDIYGLPLLGVIPESDALSDALPWESLSLGEAEAIRMIRAQLTYFNVDRDLRALLVISAEQGDGKTTVSRRLAEAGAAMGARTLIVEADMRAPTLASELAVGSGAGLSDVLAGGRPLQDAVQKLYAGPIGSAGVKHQMDLLQSGSALPPNPGELIESQAMQSLLSQMTAGYQFIVIDTPPLNVVSDAFPLLSKADGVIVVGRMGRRREAAEQLKETLEKAGAPVLGVVANGYRTRRGHDKYTYEYRGRRS